MKDKYYYFIQLLTMTILMISTKNTEAIGRKDIEAIGNYGEILYEDEHVKLKRKENFFIKYIEFTNESNCNCCTCEQKWYLMSQHGRLILMEESLSVKSATDYLIRYNKRFCPKARSYLCYKYDYLTTDTYTGITKQDYENIVTSVIRRFGDVENKLGRFYFGFPRDVDVRMFFE